MNRYDRREAAVREILEASPPQVPAGLYQEALRRGRRVRRRRAALRRLLWAVLCAAAVAFAVWAAVAQPWQRPPADTTPTIVGW